MTGTQFLPTALAVGRGEASHPAATTCCHCNLHAHTAPLTGLGAGAEGQRVDDGHEDAASTGGGGGHGRGDAHLRHYRQAGCDGAEGQRAAFPLLTGGMHPEAHTAQTWQPGGVAA